MVYFCADDYGISKEGNDRIEQCLKDGVLNKVSVLPNGEIADFKQRLSDAGATVSLHINLIEGKPLSKSEDVNLLISENGYFKYSFIGLFLQSLGAKRKDLERQLYKEIQSQIRFWKMAMGEDEEALIDSHQHTHMVPLVFKTLMRVIEDEGVNVKYIRIPAEPILPYVLTPSLYLSYSLQGIAKQWILKTLALINSRRLKKIKTEHAYFMGALFSGRVTEEKIKKLLPLYLKKAEKKKRNIEICLHPGYSEDGEILIEGSKPGFRKFYFSHWRKIEYDALMKFKF